MSRICSSWTGSGDAVVVKCHNTFTALQSRGTEGGGRKAINFCGRTLLGKGASIYDVRTEGGMGDEKRHQICGQRVTILRTKRGRGSENPKILRTSYLEAPCRRSKHRGREEIERGGGNAAIFHGQRRRRRSPSLLWWLFVAAAAARESSSLVSLCPR